MLLVESDNASLPTYHPNGLWYFVQPFLHTVSFTVKYAVVFTAISLSREELFISSNIINCLLQCSAVEGLFC